MRAGDVGEGDDLALANWMPDAPAWTAITPELAELLGLLAADGYVSADGGQVRFTNNDFLIRCRAMELWSRLFMGLSRDATGTSGFDVEASVDVASLSGARNVGPWLREQLYTERLQAGPTDRPQRRSASLQRAFLAGHYAGDGLKRGNGESIKTNSAVLAQGLCLLYFNQGSQLRCTSSSGATYYQLNLRSAARVGAKGRICCAASSPARAGIYQHQWVFI